MSEYPDDWHFGGPRGTDPRADPRWLPDTYEYLDDKLVSLHTTQTPLNDEQAINEFAKVADFAPSFKPVWLMVRRHGAEKSVMLKAILDD